MTPKIQKIDVYRKAVLLNETDFSGSGGLEEELINQTLFDIAGNELEKVTFTRGQEEERIVTVFENGRLVSESLVIGGEQVEKTEYSYDDNGRIVRETRIYQEGDTDEIEYLYDDDGHLLRRQISDSEGEEGEKNEWAYRDGKVISEEKYNIFGELESEKTYLYDDEGHMFQMTELVHSPDTSTRIETHYNPDKSVSVEKRYNHHGHLVARTLYDYDDSGNNVSIEEETQVRKVTTHNTFDEAGNLTGQKQTDADGNVMSEVVRTFDEYGRLQHSTVKVEPTQMQPGTNYSLRYEYTFFDGQS